MPLRKVLVGSDLSRASHEAARSAATLARATGARLEIYCAVPPDAAPEDRIGKFVDDVGARLREMGDDVGIDIAWSCSADVKHDAAEAIVSRGRRRDADLVVVAPRSHTRWHKFLLGSVSGKVLRLAPPMLLLSRAGWSRPPTRILLAVDREPGGFRAMRLGFELAQALGARVHVLNVTPEPGLMVWLEDAVLDELDAVSQREAAALPEWADFVKEHAPPDLSVIPLVREGPPAPTIVAEARRLRSDLIVIGTHGKTRAHELFVGGVARGVATAATCSVLLVRARPKHRMRRPHKPRPPTRRLPE